MVLKAFHPFGVRRNAQHPQESRGVRKEFKGLRALGYAKVNEPPQETYGCREGFKEFHACRVRRNAQNP